MTEKLTRFALICLCVLPVWLIIRKPWVRPASRPEGVPQASDGNLEIARPRRPLADLKRRPACEIAMCLFVAYIAALLVMALEGSWSSPAAMLQSARERLSSGEGLRFIPFETIRQQLSTIGTDESRTQLLGNTLLFLPWGFFLPLLWQRFRRFFPIAGMCLGLTCFIEFTQLFIGRTVDVDDLILNFAGSMVGAGIAWLVRRLRKE